MAKTSKQLSAPAMDEHDLECLTKAHHCLEHPSFAARLTNVVGTPIDIALQLLPKSWYRRLHGAAEAAIRKALDVGMSSMRHEHEPSAHEGLYRTLAAGSGAVGGLFGLPGLLVELPVTTTLMLRGIAEIARHEGEHIRDPETQAACLEVFALGGRSELDDAADTGYYGVRMALAVYMGSSILTPAGGVPHASAQLVHAVANRFGASLSQRGAAQLMPVIGALGAATINTIFMHHFQDMARGHFTVRRLERKYGAEVVRSHYERLSAGA
jgi:hypothetical protein